MSKYLFKVKFTSIENTIKDYLIEFPEIPDLEPILSVKGKELDDAKEYLWSYIRKNKNIPDIKNKNIKLNENQFIKNIEIDTDIISQNYSDKPMHQQVFSSITCMAACEGMCKRVLKDIKKEYEGLPISVLKDYYRHDRDHGGNDYKNIIELGEFLKSLQ